ncbi:tetratricopeptide repeat protein [Paractinoplanes globisporus]|uniref:Tetratricopeptide repeat protein n=1 Tax=Paractinoplanes globisporus TaxID=113565 RepID=A0ABW6WDS1_9ACTN|nr:tetratricopeptide repeat protein [Actinoplanes globisporus]
MTSETVLAAIRRHHQSPEVLRQWARDNLGLFDRLALDELERLVLDSPGPGTRLAGGSDTRDLFDPERVAENVFAPADIKVELLLLDLLEMISSLRRDHTRQLGILQQWTTRLVQLGVLDDAHDRCQAALTLIRERGLGDEHETDMRQQLAIIFQEAGLHDRAVSEFERVLEFDVRSGDRLGVARTTGNLAIAHGAAGDQERALALHGQAAEHFTACAEDPRWTVPAVRGAGLEYLQIGLTLEKMHREDEALTFLDHGTQILRAMPGESDRPLVTALLAMARCARTLGLADQALAAAEEAATRAAEAGMPELAAEARDLLRP